MIKPYWTSSCGRFVIYCGDCIDVLPTLVPALMRLVVTDPPYKDVLQDDWDRQWDGDDKFLAWSDKVLGLISPLMTYNASLYWFASPRMASRVECKIRERFSVLNNLVWCKGDMRKGVAGSGIDVTSLRVYWPASERIIFAERFGSDGRAMADAGYVSVCESTKRQVIGDYMRDEISRAGVTAKQIAELFPSKTGGLTGCVSNWLLGANVPTLEQYNTIREYLNSRNGSDYLRREYEDLRRPMNLTTEFQYGDVWTFSIERDRDHPAQKPVALIQQTVAASSRIGDTILDPFMGSGTTGVACARLDRRFIGIEISKEYCDIAVERIKRELSQPRLALEEKPIFEQAGIFECNEET